MKYKLNRFYNKDCMLAIKEFPDKYFDLAIVDPPYGINASNMTMRSNKNRKGNNQYPGISTAEKIRKGRLNGGSGQLKNMLLNKSDMDWDNFPPNSEYFKELFRVSKNQIIWGGNYFNLPPSRGIIVWDKMQPWENFSQVEIAWTSFNMPAAIFRYSNTGGINKEKKIHPTQKPIALYAWLLQKYAEEGFKILDTHVGSASSLIACHNLNFEYIGFEKDAYYFNLAMERLENHKKQKFLFA